VGDAVGEVRDGARAEVERRVAVSDLGAFADDVEPRRLAERSNLGGLDWVAGCSLRDDGCLAVS
jgi:hypothetical protein